MRTSTSVTVVTPVAATTTLLVVQNPDRMAIIISALADTTILHESADLTAGGILLAVLGTSYICLHRDMYGDLVTRPWFGRQVLAGAITVIEIVEVR